MNPCRVLLVDDEVEFVQTVARRLERNKLSVQAVHSGDDALRHLAGNPTDVVVLDVKMPGMDGIEALRRIKTLQPLVEVIMLTGHASVEAAIDGMELGAFDYLMKPVEFEELLYKIQDAHGKKSLQEAKIRSLKG
ncbi:MAG: response regulator [Deltaproteobacteria bacterium]|nr:response regulator [Deltaproteobacteria bacterium]